MRSLLHLMARAATPTGRDHREPTERDPQCPNCLELERDCCCDRTCPDCGELACTCARLAEGDLTSPDHRRWYEVGTGKLTLQLSGEQVDHLEWYLHDWCEEQGCFPTFWLISDHGNPSLVVPEKAPPGEPKCPRGHYGPWEFRFRTWQRAPLKSGRYGTFQWEVDYSAAQDDNDFLGAGEMENRLVCVCDEYTDHGYLQLCNQEIDLDEPRALYDAGVRDLDHFLMY